ncbi:MAG: aminoacyl-tRNA hydrolase [Candidatus Cloacimonetes bacterium]|jgi:PTH1 family peptidyl-tRNA hydrolase|nr:aminoacyl-tRNA hydrolase [Candidatus Cloacimonadota bacterium]
MRLVVGLGNPGKKYKYNRHNIGFAFLDSYIKKLDLKFKRRTKYDYLMSDDVIFIKPKTYMNRSGDAIISVLTKHRIDEILVIVDDIHLPIGEIRIRKNGGNGGHNGLRSIVDALGSSEFGRIRIGVGSPIEKDLSNYVLSDFSKKEVSMLNVVFDLLNILLEDYQNFNLDRMVNKYSNYKKSYSEKILDSQDR